MTTLIIKDLAVTAELGRKAMTAVRGGIGKSYTMQGYSSPYDPKLSFPKNEFNFDATQLLSQSQNTEVNNGNNVAFASGITANVNPTQHGTNTINFG
ncbi:hypothetical protein [Noviherbaspirillum autotrophicum]|uniref:Uncharacterized protein n=1 Tax=Noviherbaspirillum autotrophicum TaxID=709839 RepID=A0A0C2BZ68_9BURK|nr:hypothetical protein [Noviherbaspirillum autotrophicum]KIF83311.1 hypothetical protein TSA66_24725 [Noviherbaspirillum autotrophicum]